MKTPEQIAADEAAELAEESRRPAPSFRADTEAALAQCHERLTVLEGKPAGGVDEEGNSLAGKVRTFEARILAVETIQAENTSNILRVADLVQTQIAGLNQRLAGLEAAPKPGQ